MGNGSGIYYYYAEHCTTHQPSMICSPNPLSPLGCNNPTVPPCVPQGGAAAASMRAEDGPSQARSYMNGTVHVFPGCCEAFANEGGHPFSTGWWCCVPGVVEPRHTDCWWLPDGSNLRIYFRLFRVETKCNHYTAQCAMSLIGAQLNILCHPDRTIRRADSVVFDQDTALATVTLAGVRHLTFCLGRVPRS
jgi:hypothetical protein